MKRLERVGEPPAYIDRHNAIIDAKHLGTIKITLDALRGDVAARYVVYENAFNTGTLHTVTEDTNMQLHETALQHCYKKGTKPLRQIFKDIKDAQQPPRVLQKCPYCGITLPKTHDHYLPETPFPEFSAHALNLVPCCNECNSKKGARWVDVNGRMFVHFYLDPLPNDQYLQVQLSTNPGSIAVGVSFSLVRPATITDNNIWSLIESHFENLSLLNRYREEGNNEISEIFDVCVSHLEAGGVDVAGFLMAYSERNANVFGVNHWRVVLWMALSQDQNFIASINQAVV